jgi:hypothetical protein
LTATRFEGTEPASRETAQMADEPARLADYERAQIRLARASDAWLNAYEAEGVTDEIWVEYNAALDALAAIDPVRADGEWGG